MSWIRKRELMVKPEILPGEVEGALDQAAKLVIRNLPEFTEYFPKAYSENGFYAATPNVDWTTGFWTGEVWLAYEHTGRGELLQAGRVQMDSFLERRLPPLPCGLAQFLLWPSQYTYPLSPPLWYIPHGCCGI